MSQTWRRLLRRMSWLVGGLVMAVPGPVAADDLPALAPVPVESVATEPAVARYKLAFKFRPGEVVRYEVTNRSEMITVKGGIKKTDSNSCQSRKSYKVTAVDGDGAGDLELLLEWVHMTEESDDGISRKKQDEFKSDDPTKQPARYFAVKDTVGRPQAIIRFTPTGRALQVKAVDPNQPVNPKAGAAPGTDASYESYLIPLPPVPVAIGETWKERFEIPARDEKLPVRIAMQRSYTLKEVKDGLATIEYRTAILTPILNPMIQGQLIERATSGRIVFDVERGIIESRELSINNTVQNAIGPDSQLQAKRTFRERRLPDETVQREDASNAATSNK